MSYIHPIQLICDAALTQDCVTIDSVIESQPDETILWLRRRLRRDGWKRVGQEDICPACLEVKEATHSHGMDPQTRERTNALLCEIELPQGRRTSG